ncbi:uncharacterized protein QC764_0109760 [Podospora pseudoanserina]|uniref:Uncharacterized protein n=1 Tax=Podospora pseudoanserina TaxID=2609844 RepID=A0ABR0HI87_9PEZI|nr:hypothetical protein QC764_0109760 [Podospora pseudoanserina]
MSAPSTRSATPCGSEPDEIVDDSGVQTPSEPDNSVVVQKLYETDCCCGSCPSRLSKHVNVDEERSSLEAEVSDIPIIQRHPGSDQHVANSITVNCPSVRDVLVKALENYYQDPDTLTAENWTLNASFQPLVHR